MRVLVLILKYINVQNQILNGGFLNALNAVQNVTLDIGPILIQENAKSAQKDVQSVLMINTASHAFLDGVNIKIDV